MWQGSIQVAAKGLLWWGRDGTGQDFLDPTGKFQNHRRLTGRSTGF